MIRREGWMDAMMLMINREECEKWEQISETSRDTHRLRGFREEVSSRMATILCHQSRRHRV